VDEANRTVAKAAGRPGRETRIPLTRVGSGLTIPGAVTTLTAMSYTLLLADDSVTVQRVIELTFADEGFKVVSFSDGDEVVGYLGAGHTPDVILADTTMPARDGYDVAAWVRGQTSLAQVPVVLMTGAFEPIDDQRALACQADAVLVKPFEPQQVVSLVKRMLGGERGDSLGEFAPPTPGGTAPVPEGVVALAPGVDTYASRLDQHLAARQGRATLSRVEAPALPPVDHQTPAPEPASPAAFAEPASAPKEAPATGPTPPATTSTLATAFSAMLAEERGEGPAAVGPTAVPAVSDAFVDELARRVAQRLTDQVLREIVSARVLDVAERLISEEIERIKAGAR
jgi:CheY-like chemotaxis protein